MTHERVQRTYLTLVLLQTLAASLIWGVNTLFLLDAGLSITEAFVANAAFTLGMVIFEVPTGVVADAAGRRTSFILGAVTLLVATLAYLALWYVGAGIGWWVVSSAFIGLGFTFFSGATEAWLVDALTATGFPGSIEEVFGKGQTAVGTATLIGTISGGFLAQISLGLPYLARSLLLVAVIVAAYLWMHDIGYTPARTGSVSNEVRTIFKASVEHGWRNRPVRMFMLAAPFSAGVGIWAFYAFQPYLLQLFGDESAVYLSGIAAAIFALAQMVGGASVRWARRRFDSRSSVIITQATFTAIGLGSGGGGSGARHPHRVLGGYLAVGDDRPDRGAVGTDAAGVHQRRHPVAAASHGPVVHVADGKRRRGGRPARPGPGRRRLLIGPRLCRRRCPLRLPAPVPLGGAPDASPRRRRGQAVGCHHG